MNNESLIHYGVTIRPTAKYNIEKTDADINYLIETFNKLCVDQNLECENYSVEKGNHLHALVKSNKKLNYRRIKQDNYGWHIYMREKRNIELDAWRYYIAKDTMVDFTEYAFI